jgi:hypothetical protein
MTVVTPPNIVPDSGRPPEDDLDGLLRAYFQAEMPDPWPSFEAPAPRNGVLPLRRPQQPRRFNLWRSRLALAASILLLIAGALFLFSGSRMNDAAPFDPLKRGPVTGSRPELDKPAPDPFIQVDPDGARFRQDIPLDKFPMR